MLRMFVVSVCYFPIFELGGSFSRRPSFLILEARFVCCTPPKLMFWCSSKESVPLKCYNRCERGKEFLLFLIPVTVKALLRRFTIVLVL